MRVYFTVGRPPQTPTAQTDMLTEQQDLVRFAADHLCNQFVHTRIIPALPPPLFRRTMSLSCCKGIIFYVRYC